MNTSKSRTTRLESSLSVGRAFCRALLLGSMATLAFGVACSSDKSSGDGGDTQMMCTDGGGAVTGAADTHCTEAQSIGVCQATAQGENATGSDEAYETRYGNQADDDDCKYHVSFTNTCITVNQPVTFTVKVVVKANGAAASGAVPNSPEIFLADDDSHISQSNDIQAPESPPGTYKIGPIVFDRSGRWVVRFHLFETCSDIPEDSPHGHVAFYVDVP